MVVRCTASAARALAIQPKRGARRAADGLSSLTRLSRALAVQGRSLLSEVIGEQSAVHAWNHFPPNDAYDRQTGYRWYYHCHPRGARTTHEHGHFHLFSDRTSGSQVTHLIAISVSDRGLPLGLFTANRWVTDEHWQPAARVLRLIRGFALSSPKSLHRVHAWLARCLQAFAPQVHELLKARDRRLEGLYGSARTNVLEDRRIAVLSRCQIDLFAQAAAIDRRLEAVVKVRGEMM